MKEGKRYLLATVVHGSNEHNTSLFLVSVPFAIKRQSVLLDSGFSRVIALSNRVRQK